MKTIFAAIILFGVAIGSLIYVNSNDSRNSWIVAGTGYLIALFVVQFLGPGKLPKSSIRFNITLAMTVTILIFLDTLVFHHGIFKDMNSSLGSTLYKLAVLVVAVGVPTAILGALLGAGLRRKKPV